MKYTNSMLAQICLKHECRNCPQDVKEECLQNACWKEDEPYARCCPAVYYGLIPSKDENTFGVWYYKKWDFGGWTLRYQGTEKQCKEWLGTNGKNIAYRCVISREKPNTTPSGFRTPSGKWESAIGRGFNG